MIKYIKYILNIIVLLFLTINVICNDGSYSESLSYDEEKVLDYQKNGKFDYNSQLSSQEVSLWDMLKLWLARALEKFFGSKFAETYVEPILIIIFIIIILIVIFLIIRKRPELFKRSKKKNIVYKIDEETIYDVNFEEELNNSLRSKDYKMAVRIVYLQTLRYLNDNSYINWEPYKTPTEYIYEFKKDGYKDDFLKLTNHFLRIRYGNFEATESTYKDVHNLQSIIMKGGRNEA